MYQIWDTSSRGSSLRSGFCPPGRDHEASQTRAVSPEQWKSRGVAPERLVFERRGGKLTAKCLLPLCGPEPFSRFILLCAEGGLGLASWTKEWKDFVEESGPGGFGIRSILATWLPPVLTPS